jgi:hypothetical protein
MTSADLLPIFSLSRIEIESGVSALKPTAEVLCMTTNNSEGEYVALGYDLPKTLAAFWTDQLERIRYRAESEANRTPPCLEGDKQIRFNSGNTNRN